ncbi:MAG: cytochrome c oxidase subunit II [Sphaerospermopsis sp. SIO1G1]|nr:cytochrome c oxidase subunit II [Sphaerospermopsis sp. SIO1G1]
MKIPSTIWTLLIGIVLTLVSLWYGQNHGLLPIAASDEAVLIDDLFNAMLTVSIGIFLIVEGVLIYSALKYRRRAGDNEDGPPIDGNVPLEILWTAIPAIIVLGISVYSFDVYNQIGGLSLHGGHEMPMMEEAMSTSGTAIAATLSNTPENPEQNPVILAEATSGIGTSEDIAGKSQPLVVEVAALQYAWLFTYPDTGLLTGELHVPVGKEVQLNMTANDVIHAFWVPEFRLKQDVIPGQETKVNFTSRKVGQYPLICAELCGPYHGVMQSRVVVESQADFDGWMQSQQVAAKEDLNKAVAVNSQELSADEFLAPYTHNMGIHSEMLHQVHR